MLTKRLQQAAFFLLLTAVAAITFSISLYEVVSILFILVSLAAMIINRDSRAVKGRWMVFIAIYFIANLLSLTQTHYMPDSLKGVLRVFRSAALCISVIYALDTEDKFVKVFKWCLVVAFLVAVDGLFQSFAGWELIRHRPLTNFVAGAGRVTACFRQANDFSGYITLLIFFFIGIIASLPKLALRFREIFFLMAGFASLFLCLLWTYSRGAWASIALSFFIFSLVNKKKVLLFCGITVLAAAVLLSPPLMRQRFQSMLDVNSGSIAERKYLMDESMNMIEKSPWFGLGINTFSDNAPFFKSKVHPTDLEYAHNGYLQMAVETGIVGLLSFLFVLGYFIISTALVFLKNNGSFLGAAGSGVLFGVIAFLIHSAMDTNLHSLLLVSNLWLCMGMGFAASELARSKSKA